MEKDPLDQVKEQTQALVHEFKELDTTKLLTRKVITLFVAAAVVGIGTGFLLSQKGGIANMNKSGGTVASGKAEGSNDLSTFKDKVEGQLVTGGIDGEGQYHLVRPGGDSQNVYLVSSVVDLSKYVGQKIRVWGQTQKAQKAGWLMDVGRVEVL